MTTTGANVSELIERFQLRRRASTEAFDTGVHLARSGEVTVTSLGADLITADVRDPAPLSVQLYVDSGSLVGRCPCAASASGICRHHVAVAHAVWMDLRRVHGQSVDDAVEGLP